MTKITFLHGARDRVQAASAWIASASSMGMRILVFAPLEKQREALDRLLWTQAATSFTPHCDASSPLANDTPVIIAASLDQLAHDECLLNLSNQIPPGFSRFQHLTEIVSTADSDRLPGRERFRFYRERGYPLESRDMAGDA
ncbi:MAG: DNA polymerase III subunit chi [Rugosibacter sp.]|nr:DNA polymerase III subunit chi [Rugosibacter sp.]